MNRDNMRAAEPAALAAEPFAGIGTLVNEDDLCECKAGMFPRGVNPGGMAVSRRQIMAGAGLAAGAVAAAALPGSARAQAKKAPPGAVWYDVPDKPYAQPGRNLGEDGGYGTRSQFESEVRWGPPTRVASWSPLERHTGIITPSGLHFERHHNGIPTIDPARHVLVIHGLVERPMKFTVADLRRFPSISRILFMECSGNSGSEYKGASTGAAGTVQRVHGLTSTSEWTGVHLATLLRQTGIKDGAKWIVAEGADAAMMNRSIPLDKCLDDAFIAYGQNGEAIRPEQGYPMRVMLPGWEGNISIKWLQRLEVTDKPYQTREETSKYSDIITKTGKARQFTLTMDAKSVITFPSGEMRLPGPGFYEVTGLAWSGRGKIDKVEVSTDGGQTWYLAHLQEPVLDKAHTRFRFPWMWDGQPAILQSRATDTTGYTQPTFKQVREIRGQMDVGFLYHQNSVQSWSIAADGSVKNVHHYG